MGTQELPINEDDEVFSNFKLKEITFFKSQIRKNSKSRKMQKFKSKKIKKIFLNFQFLHLRNNLIEKIEGLENCPLIEELELYDNKIKVIYI